MFGPADTFHFEPDPVFTRAVIAPNLAIEIRSKDDDTDPHRTFPFAIAASPRRLYRCIYSMAGWGDDRSQARYASRYAAAANDLFLSWSELGFPPLTAPGFMMEQRVRFWRVRLVAS